MTDEGNEVVALVAALPFAVERGRPDAAGENERPAPMYPRELFPEVALFSLDVADPSLQSFDFAFGVHVILTA